MSIKDIFKKITGNKKPNHELREVDNIFNYLTKITIQPDAVENFSEEFYKIKKKYKQNPYKPLIKLYLEWEEFIVSNQPLENNKHISKPAFRQKIKNLINIQNLHREFRLLFLDSLEQELYLYEHFINYLTSYIVKNLGYGSLVQTMSEFGANTIFENIETTPKGINFSKLHKKILEKTQPYPKETVKQSFKGLVNTLYNKIDLSLGDKITQGIFSSFLQEIRSVYNSEIATILIKIIPEKVLNLDDWLSVLSKTELEKQVRDKTRELESLNDSLETKVAERTRDLEKAYMELKELDKKKSEFISVAAHQLRTPLNGIKWTLNMLVNEDLGAINEEQKKFLRKTYETNERMLAIINDMLDTDLIVTGKATYELTPTNIYEIIDNVIFQIAPNANGKNITVQKPSYDQSIALVLADAQKISLVLENLTDNAIKYSGKNSTITIKTEKDGDFIKITVSDSGIGIPEQEQSDIFKRFFRTTNAIRTENSGSGLGLFITKNIIKKHNGKIWFESSEGQGTTFIFTIPLARKMKV